MLQLPPKPGDSTESKLRSLAINLRRIGPCNGHVILKIAFVALDVATKKKAVNGETEKEAEAVHVKGNDYSVASEPFIYVFPSWDKKAKKIPASGTKPIGWIVRVFQDNRLLTIAASTPELMPWLATQVK